ncbi:hypothetical protein [Acinetobacter sp.]|uniref:hypothetical protein n=1 Tax=Acinetobacter sp. TaxID=472 RepID=UPI00375117D8
MKELTLSNHDDNTLLDDEDYELYKDKTWSIYRLKNGKIGGVVTSYQRHKKLFLHRLIMSVTDPKIFVDHKDLNTLNNQKLNLRLCSGQENSRNTGLSSNNRSGIKGVCWETKVKKWRAAITINSKQVFLGHFTNLQEAADVYDIKAIEIYGEFAKTNKQLQEIVTQH